MRVVLMVFVFCLVAAVTAEESTTQSQLSRLLGSGDNDGYPKAIEPREFVFPDDYGPHPEYRNEWWYVTGNLDSDYGRRFGFELTFFRFALSPSEVVADSGWRSKQVYIAHFAVTDADRERFFVAERFSRGAVGLAGSEAFPFRVWIDDWQIASLTEGSPEKWALSAADDEFALNVSLQATKPPVLNGIEGLSQKSAEPGNASYYYSITRWLAEGSLRIGTDEFRVSGLSWLDREWGSSALADDQQGWDWFALQLSDGSELMFYNIRTADGTQDPMSAGTRVSVDGEARHLSHNDIEVEVVSTWRSAEGGVYPSAWQVRLPSEGLSLEVVPVMDDQELFTTVRYWEGAVDVTGRRNGSAVSGRGYVELTGYAGEPGSTR